MPQTINLEDVVSSAFGAVLQGVWTAMVGRVERLDPDFQTVNVQLVVKNRYVGEDGEIEVETLPVINNVPLVVSGGGSFRTTYPIAVGDSVLVIFLSRSHHEWLYKGGIQDPGDDNRHKICDAIAIGQIRDFTRPLNRLLTSVMTIGHDEGAQLEFSQHGIRVSDGVAPSEPTFLANSYSEILLELFTQISVAIGGVTGGGAVVGALNTAIGNFSDAISGTLTTVLEVA